jgi:flagellar biosynthetic protein FliR
VIIPAEADLVSVGLVYCRVAPCIMLLPGFGQQQIPMRIRGLLSFFVTLAVWGALAPDARIFAGGSLADRALVAASEFGIGVTIALIGRGLMSAIEAFAAAISAMVGLSMNIGTPLDSQQQAPALGALCSMVATASVFASDLHLAAIRALVESYSYELLGGRGTAAALEAFVDMLVHGFRFGLSIAGPFLMFSVVANVILAVLGKMTPQLQIFFIAAPFLIAGGLLILHRTAAGLVPLFAEFLHSGLVLR